MTADQLLSIIEEAIVTAAVEEAVARFPFAEEVFFAAKWRVARDFECGHLIAGSNPGKRLLYLPPNKIARSPGLLVRYFQGKDDFGYPAIVVDWVQYLEYDEAKALAPRAFVANG
jgi:hypothetical protein